MFVYPDLDIEGLKNDSNAKKITIIENNKYTVILKVGSLNLQLRNVKPIYSKQSQKIIEKKEEQHNFQNLNDENLSTDMKP